MGRCEGGGRCRGWGVGEGTLWMLGQAWGLGRCGGSGEEEGRDAQSLQVSGALRAGLGSGETPWSQEARGRAVGGGEGDK